MTALIRERLKGLFSAASDAHPGLLLQRGFPDDDGAETKTKHIRKVCASRPDPYYNHAFSRWRKATEDASRFHAVELKLRNRMFTGLAGGGMVETGCAISHSYGMPYIPGSSVKGVVSAHARGRLDADGKGNEACDQLFGAGVAREHPAGISGLISFHDAWWVPGSAKRPFVQEVVTTHHIDYYGSDGATPATDFDSPVPNAQVAVQGSFRFLLEGPPGWLPLAEKMLIAALSERGIGAKTRAGYGLFGAEPERPTTPGCPWVDEKVEELMRRHNSKADDIIRGMPLAEAWKALQDADLKDRALADIRSRWEKKGWWESPPGRASRRAKAIYEAQ